MDSLHIFLAALRLLTDATLDQPLLALVDDAQWLDGSSAAALGFASRRLSGHRIALLCAAHAHGDVPSSFGDLPSVVVPGFSVEEASRLLLQTTSCSVPVEITAQLVAATRGNPLALRELGRNLSQAQLDGKEPLPQTLPVTQTVEHAFLARVRRLSRDAQDLLLVAAADTTAPLSAVLHAAEDSGTAADDALTELERSGLVVVERGHLNLEHPLLVSAVYAAASTLDRRRAHRSLATALTGETDRARRTWHRAAAAIPPDSNVAAGLDHTAHEAQLRGDHQSASLTWEHAVTFAERPSDAARYAYLAASAAWLTCQPERALRLVDTGLSHALEPVACAGLQELRARIHGVAGSAQFGHRILLDAATEVAVADPSRARHLAMLAAALATFGGHSGTSVEARSFAALGSGDHSPRDRCTAHLLRGLCALRGGLNEFAVNELGAAQRVPIDLEHSDRDLLPSLALAALLVGDYDLAQQHHETLLLMARECGETIYLVKALNRLLFTDIAHTEIHDLTAHADEVSCVVAGHRQQALGITSQIARVWAAALCGTTSYNELLAEVQAHTPDQTAGILSLLRCDLLRWARALHEGPGSMTALHHLAQMRHPVMQRMAGIDRVEAAVRGGHPELARLWADDLCRFAGLTGQDWAAAAAAHGEALLADPGTASAHFECALQHHAASRRTFDRVRTELAYGSWLRRNRRRREARTHLLAAVSTLEDLGAVAWLEHAKSELRAAGTAPQAAHGRQVSLTPQEHEVTRLVSMGLSSKEIAEHLTLSRRTVDFHLRNIFAKTGVTSRVELALWSNRAG